MVNDYDKWDMKVAEWRGYTLKALEDLNDNIIELKEEIKEIKKSNIRRDKRIYIMSGTLSTIIVALGWVIPNVIL